MIATMFAAVAGAALGAATVFAVAWLLVAVGLRRQA